MQTHGWFVSAVLVLALGAAPPQASSQVKFTGVGSCTANACHEKEHKTWLSKDKHSRAFAALRYARSLQIGKNLKLTELPERSPVCLACHAVEASASRRGEKFDLGDGVTCEACHGAAEKYLDDHYTGSMTPEQKRAAGMADTKSIVARAGLCVSCHVGGRGKSVDHDLIAAGHPDLIFELETAQASEPPHWKEPAGLHRAQVWATGQVSALAAHLRQVARRAEDGDGRSESWPDFADLDCYACHHDLRLPSWRQERGYAGTAGRPTWNGSRHAALRHLVDVVSPKEAEALDASVRSFRDMMDRPQLYRRQIGVLAAEIAARIEALRPQIAHRRYQAGEVLDLLRRVTGDAEGIGRTSVAAADQAALSVDALSTAWREAAKPANGAAVAAAVRELLDGLDQPEAFNPGAFAERMKKIRTLLE